MGLELVHHQAEAALAELLRHFHLPLRVLKHVEHHSYGVQQREHQRARHDRAESAQARGCEMGEALQPYAQHQRRQTKK